VIKAEFSTSLLQSSVTWS